MKVADIIHGRISPLEVRRRDDESFPHELPDQAELSLLFSDIEPPRLQIRGSLFPVEGVHHDDQDRLQLIANHNLPRLVWLLQRIPDRPEPDSLLIQIHEFPSAWRWTDALDIGVDEQLVDDIRRRLRRLISIERAIEWLNERMLLTPQKSSEPPRVLLSASPSVNPEQETAFRLYGAGFAVDVKRGSDERMRATRVVESRRAVSGDEARPILLVTGQIRFCDATLANKVRGVVRTEIDALMERSDSYLSLWRSYNEKERQLLLRRARDLGWVRYEKVEARPDGSWRFQLSRHEGEDARQFVEHLRTLDQAELEAGEEVPEAILGIPPQRNRRALNKPLVGKVSAILPGSIEIRPEEEHEDRKPPGKGCLFLSLGGDHVRLERRERAWERIRTCQNPMPQLGLLLEDQPVRERKSRTLQPMTTAVKRVFANPNDRQLLALKTALNTPDIALIQGPPGTGKTRVIAALQARLAESDQSVNPDGLAGNTLLTSFQHEAVENAARATLVMGLPAIKVGYRRGEADSADGVLQWARQTAASARDRRGQERTDSVHQILTDVRALVVSYLGAPGPHEAPADVLRSVLELASVWLPPELVDQITLRQTALRTPTEISDAAMQADDERAFALRAAEALPTDIAGFLASGSRTAHKVIKRLRRVSGFSLTEAQRACLDEVRDWPPATPPDSQLLERVQAVRSELARALRGQSPGEPAADADNGGPDDIQPLLVRVLDVLGQRAHTTARGVDTAVAEWIADLEGDPNAVRDTLQHYSMVLAATCQQSVSRYMQDAKRDDNVVFQTVVVDEAARANPLDLFIPLACGERRIVLVGDHRQLPQMLEPDVERELEQSVSEETTRALGQSLFEKLFVELRAREKRDHCKRVVTLNVQYRMHPLLGDFVSRQFYDRHGEGFTSGRDADDFAHTVTLTDGRSLAGSVAAWLDVSAEHGLEMTHKKSKYRPPEAERLAREVRSLLTTRPDISIGVIAFYARQRDEILAALERMQITERDGTGSYRVRRQWRHLDSGEERLRVGTVDAFQGKEFDVVFLSITRCNHHEIRDEATRRRRYGFLLVENRMCVAMSRQRRLLIAVGDLAITRSTDATESVPALVAFRQLCEGPHGAILSE